MDLPAIRAFALHACLRKRMGCRFGGPDYATTEMIKSLKKEGRL